MSSFQGRHENDCPSPDHTPFVPNTAQSTTTVLPLLLGLATKRVPESKRLVSSARDDGIASRTHAQIQDPEGVARERDDLGHARILPYVDGILAVAVRRDDFGREGAEEEVADLAARVV